MMGPVHPHLQGMLRQDAFSTLYGFTGYSHPNSATDGAPYLRLTIMLGLHFPRKRTAMETRTSYLAVSPKKKLSSVGSPTCDQKWKVEFSASMPCGGSWS